MSHPPAGLEFLDTSPQKPTKSNIPSGLEFLGQSEPQQTEEKQQGFIQYMHNLSKNWGLSEGFKSGQNVGEFLNNMFFNPAKNANDPVFQQASTDFVHIFDHIFSDLGSGTAADVAMAIPRIFNLGVDTNKPTESFVDKAGQVGISLFRPVSDLMELTSGMSLTGDDTRALTPEEKVQRVKSSMGLVAASAVVGPLAGSLESELLGGVGRRILANATIGAAAGGTYGAVSGANDKDQFAQILSNGIIGGTLGSAFSLLGKSKTATPQEIRQIRAIQDLDNSIAENINTAKALTTSDDLASALLQGKIGLKQGDIHVIPNVDPIKLTELDAKLPEGYRSAMHVDEDGVGHLLVRDETVPIDERFFEKTGLIKNQEVSYLGKENWTVEDASKDMIKLRNTLDGSLIEAHKNDIQHPSSINIEQKRGDIVNGLYQEWKSSLETSANEDVANANAEKYDLIGFDEEPPSDLLDKHPDVEELQPQKSLDDFLAQKKFNPDEIKSLKRELQLKLANEAYQRMSPEDRQLVDNARSVYQKDLRSPRQKVRDFNSLNRIARSNGYRVSDGGSGRVIIRSLDDNRILAGADDYQKARDWINKSGKASGPTLDDNSIIDTNNAAGGPPIPPSDGDVKYPQDDPYNFFYNDKNLLKTNWGEDVIRYLNNTPIVTRYRDYMLDLDRKYGTNFHRDVFENVTQKRNTRNAQARPYITELEKIQKAARLKPGEAEMVGYYMQTMTPEEVISSFMNRPMNPVEIGIAQKLAQSGVDLERIFNYRRELVKLDKEFPADARQDPSKQLLYQQQIEKAKQAYQMDDNHLQATKVLDGIEEFPKNQVSEGAVVRLARAINNGADKSELSKSQFAARNNLTLQQVAAANNIQNLYSKLAKAFGINEDRQLGGYMTHAKLYFDGDIPKAMKHFSGDLKTKDFYAKLSRTGEVSAYETNAFKGTLRYIKGGFDVQSGFADALTSAKNSIEKEIHKLPEGLQEQARNVTQRYLNDVQGFPEAGDRAAKEAVDYMMNKYKTGDDVDVRRTWSTAIQSVINAGALGARPMLGIGHFGISNVISIAARSIDYTRRMLSAGAKAIADRETMQTLQDKGVFQGLSPFSSMRADIDPTSFASKIGGVIDRGQDIMFKATLLPTVYDGMAAGHYLTTYNDALSGLTKFQRGEITGKQLTKDLFLRRFDANVASRFIELSKTNAEEASHYLGMQAVEDLVGTYGSGNTPYKWGTNLGRIVGQFGNYAMWIRATVQRMASRGTVADRIGSIAKLSALAYATHEASQATGIDLTRMSPVHAMTWLFGPLVHIAEDAADAMHTSGYQQQQAVGRLKRVLPLDLNGNIHPSIFVPGSFAVDGIVQAADAFSKGNITQGTLEGLGFRKYQAGKKLGRGL